jgi:hypothetical protein
VASLAAIRTAVKTTLEAAITGLRVYDKIPGATQVPAVVVDPVSANFVVAMGRGTDTWEFDLHMVVSDAEETLGQIALDDYVSGAGARSIRTAIWNARTLGLTNTDAHVSGLLAYGVRFEQAPIKHVGATLRLVVHTRGTE